MKEWLNFIEQYSVDDELYWQLTLSGTDISFEIQWRRSQALAWRIKPLNALFWTQLDRDGLLLTIQRENLNLTEFEQSLRRTVLQQGVYGYSIFAAARELLGEAPLKEELRDHDEFMEQLRVNDESEFRASVDAEIRVSIESVLKAHEENEINRTAPSSQRLRIVPNLIGD